MPGRTSRPTLPSLHELGLVPPFLPDMSRLSLHDVEMTDEPPSHQHQRRTSTSSTSTLASTSSRSPSPTLYDDSTSRPALKAHGKPCKRSHAPRTPSPMSQPTPPVAALPYALAPCSLSEADAVLLFPPHDKSQGPSKGIMMLTGESVRQLRHPERRIARGARLQPYKIVRDTRRRSFSPTDAMPAQGTCVPAHVCSQ
ncbi:hypothetical protein K523DRAFT_282087 [Schizophyllum commune Tattone D]|nr:hypothetical protein K523DRAFT_282087 [Schizophyllum commune Tattone D]